MGDIALYDESERNADPCTSRGCMWGKYNDGKVYVPYVIANHYCESSLLNKTVKKLTIHTNCILSEKDILVCSSNLCAVSLFFCLFATEIFINTASDSE